MSAPQVIQIPWVKGIQQQAIRSILRILMTLNKRLPHTDILLDIYTRRGTLRIKTYLMKLLQR